MSFADEKAAEDGKDEYDPNINPELLGQSVDKLDGEDDEDEQDDD